MALNVVMLGASRSGKTSILASMLHNVCNPYADNRVNQYFCVKDVSEYAALDRGRRKEVRLPSNVAGMQELLRSPENGTDYVPKMPNLFGTSFPFTYTFNIKAHINSFISSKYITINFHDIPGECYSSKKFTLVEDEIRKAQLLIVAVDVPSLMYAKEMGKKSLNKVMNCPNEVYDAIQLLGIDCCADIKNEAKRNKESQNLLRMVIFVPIKCEYWLRNNKRADIDNEIREVYNAAIERCKQLDNIQVQILPVETIGSCLFDHYSEERNSLLLSYAAPSTNSQYISEDNINGKRVVRCEKVRKNQVRLKNGVIYNLYPDDQLMEARERKVHPYCYEGGKKLIPYTWFKPIRSSYSPKYCDVLFCQVLKFSIMDFAKRTGRSAREAFDNVHNLRDWIRALPDFVQRYFSGETAAYADILQVKKFQASILAIDISQLLDENPIVYLVNREDGYDV